MNKHLLSLLVVFLVTLTAQAQTTVRHNLRLTDNTFNFNLWGANSFRNLIDNTITLGEQWCTVGWDFVGVNTQYDSHVVKITSIDYNFTGYKFDNPADGWLPILSFARCQHARELTWNPSTVQRIRSDLKYY